MSAAVAHSTMQPFALTGGARPWLAPATSNLTKPIDQRCGD
ncbi:hypothetical protein DSM112329_04466 [Paraconexibacter sp. AEG42_29]|uniref:Uncharacterized protein n=1 Tax=Paraconexibacter sp. AEG42_29 TaxID=2997339 RepID=A0AAU7B120_9ACTN